MKLSAVIMTVVMVTWSANSENKTEVDDGKINITLVGSIPKHIKVGRVQLEYEPNFPCGEEQIGQSHLVYKSCQDVPTPSGSGVYNIDLFGQHKQVYCEINLDGTKYMVIQRRINGSENFYRNWMEYENGFGYLKHEFWIGNKALYAITSQANYRLRIDLLAFDSIRKFAEYDSFSVGSPETKYKLTVSGYIGNAGDSLTPHNGGKFSTFDEDNDSHDKNCASEFKGAWWYIACHQSNLNGFYYKGHHESYADGINWYLFKGYHDSMMTTAMKIYY